MMKTILLVLLLVSGGILFAACSSSAQNKTSAQEANSSADNAAGKRAGDTKNATVVNAETSGEQPQKQSGNAENLKASTEETGAQNGGYELRCGWYSNPTQGNHWIEDKNGEWIIGTQGGDQAEGDYPPEFKAGEWVQTNGNYGYGCACLRVKTDKKNKRILEVKNGYSKPLSACRSDRALQEPKDE